LDGRYGTLVELGISLGHILPVPNFKLIIRKKAGVKPFRLSQLAIRKCEWQAKPNFVNIADFCTLKPFLYVLKRKEYNKNRNTITYKQWYYIIVLKQRKVKG